MTDQHDPKTERPAPRGVERGTPIAPPRPRSRNAFIIAVAALVMVGIVLVVAGGIYVLATGALRGQPSARVVLRVHHPARFEYRITGFQGDLSRLEMRVQSALIPIDLPGLSVDVSAPDRLVIESSAPDARTFAAQGVMLARVLRAIAPGLRETDRRLADVTPQHLEATRRAIERRVGALGHRARVDAHPPRRIIARLWGAADAQQLADLLSVPGRLEFVHIARQYTPQLDRDPQTGRDVVRFTDRSGEEVPEAQVLSKSSVIARGDDLKRTARATLRSTDSAPQVVIEFRPEGAGKLYDFTRTHRGSYLAIVLDGEVVSAPIVRAPIQGAAVIEGGFATPGEAKNLADLLNAGSLPLGVEVEMVRPAAPAGR